MNVSETDSGALDLSSGSRDRENMKSRSSVASHISHHSSSYQSEGKDFLKTYYFGSFSIVFKGKRCGKPLTT